MSSYTNVNESLSFFSLNLRANFSIAKPYLSEHAYGCDFICLNDHGLYKSELHKIDNLYPEYTSLPKANKHFKDRNFGIIGSSHGIVIYVDFSNRSFGMSTPLT